MCAGPRLRFSQMGTPQNAISAGPIAHRDCPRAQSGAYPCEVNRARSRSMQTDQGLPSIRDDSKLWRPRPTLGAADYTTQEVYAEEREKIWWGDWVCVGRAEEVPSPGDYSTYDIAGESIFVTRNEDG